MRKFYFLIISMLVGMGSFAQVSVTATTGTTGPTSYTTLKGAFDAINAGTHTGAITISITGNTSETAPCVLNSSGSGSASYTSVLIKPTATATISGSTTTGRGLIELNGADNVTIDGAISGSSRDLTITNTAATTVAYCMTIRIAAYTSVITSADNNTIKNCIINGNATGQNVSTVTSTTTCANASWGIYAGATGTAAPASATTSPAAISSTTTVLGTGGTINGLTISNNQINACGRGISLAASATSVCNSLFITNNTIGAATAGSSTTVYSMGINSQGFSSANISGNTVRNIESFLATAVRGIDLGAVSASGTGATIQTNQIYGVNSRNTSGYGSYGININLGTSNGTVIKNNFIYGLAKDMSGTGGFGTTFSLCGIRLAAGTGISVYHNSVNLSGSLTGTATGQLTSCLGINSTSVTSVDIRNNIFSNTMTGGTASSAHVALLLPSGATSALALTLNNNAYYTGPTVGTHGIAHGGTTYTSTVSTAGTGLYTVANFNSGAITPVTNLRNYTSTLSTSGTNDNASYASTNAAPFTSSTDLHLNTTSTEIPNVEQKGDAAVSVTTDIDGDARPNSGTTNPDMGADEIIVTACTGTPNAGSISPTTVSKCVGSTYQMTATSLSTGTGISYQWKVSTTSGSGYTDVTGGSGATTGSYTTGALTAGTYYYVLVTTCSASGQSNTSNELTLTVNANPTVTASPTSANYCTPGGTAVSITASGASTYAWSPATGLSATTGATVSATPSANTTYTVTGTDANGCTGTATSAISVAAGVSISSVTATPASICSGGTSSLNALVATSANKYSFAGSSGTFTAITGTTLGAGAIGDDVGIGNLDIGFTFPYNGTTFTKFGARSNGLIELGQTTATLSGFSANALATTANIIAPLWDDNNTTGGSIIYSTTGTAPNRVLTVQWTGMHVGGSGSSTNPTIDCQVQLFEDGTIKLIYGSTSGSLTTTTASIGISGASGNYLSVTPLSPANTSTVSSTTENTAISAAANFPSGTIYTFTPPTYTYSWSDGTNTVGTTNPLTVTPTAASTTYTVTVTNAGGCSSTGTVTVTQGAALTVAVNSPTRCSAASATALTATPTGGGGSFTYTWTPVTDLYTDAAGTVAYTGAALTSPTIYTKATVTTAYTVTATDACSQTATATSTVTVNTSPTITVNPTSATYCTGSTTLVTLTASGASTYTWSPVTSLFTDASGTTAYVANANANPVYAKPSANTTYTVTGTDGNNCTGTTTVVVAVSAPPTISSVNATPTLFCSGGTSTLNASITSVAKTYSFVASTGASLDPMAGGTTLLASGLDNSASAVTTFPGGFVFPYEGTSFTQFSVSDNGVLRLGSTAVSTTQYGSITGSILLLSPWAADMATGSNGGVSYIISGTAPNRIFIVQYKTVHTYNTTAAINNTFQIWLHETTGVIDYVYGSLASSSTFSNGIGITGASTSNYLSVASATNTVSSTSVTSNTVAPASGTMYTFTPPSFTYSWSDGTNIVGTTNPLTVSPSAASTTYTVTVTNAGGCSSTGNVTVSQAAPLSVTVNSPSRCSAAAATTLTATPTGGGANITYTWSPVTNLYTDAAGTVAYTGAALTSPTIYTKATVTTAYTVTATDACNQTATATSTVTVNPTPVITVSSNSPACEGGDLNLTATSTVANATYAWTGPNSFTSTVLSPTVTAATMLAAGTYRLTATSPDGCASNTLGTIATIKPGVSGVTATASATSINCGGTIDLIGAPSTPTTTQSILNETFETPQYWTISNGNGGNNWAYGSTASNAHGGTKYLYYGFSSSLAADAYAYFPPRYLQSGVTYTIKYWYRAHSSSYAEKLALTVGTANTIAAQSTVVQDLGSFTTTTYTQATATYTPAASGTYFFAFHAYSAANQWNIYVDDVTITAPSDVYTYAWTSTPSGFSSTTQSPTGVSPTANSTVYNLAVTNSYGCSSTASTPAITVTSTASITTQPLGATYCQNATPTDLSVIASGTGTLSYQWYSNTTHSTTGGTTVGTNSSSFTPSTATPSTTYYYVVVTNPCGTSATSDIVAVVVTPNQAISLSSASGTDAQTVCINTALTDITYSTTGATGASVSGLPTGVTGSWSNDVFTITGTPTQSGTFNYSISLTATCGTAATATGTITVNGANTITLTSATGTNVQSICGDNTAITDITYSTTGATGATVSGLPTGVTSSWSNNVVTISGTPTQSGTFNYTITLTGGCGSVTATGSIAHSTQVGWANTQHPANGNIGLCGTYTVYGQVFKSGVTEAAGAGAGITAELGWSTSNTNPNTWTNWIPATFNVQVGNNDEYMATLSNLPNAGTYYYAYRFKSGGCDYQYGGYTSSGGNFWGIGGAGNGTLTVDEPTILAGVVSSTECQSVGVGTGRTYVYSSGANCKIIAKVVPSGSSPVSGNINTCVTIESAAVTGTVVTPTEPYVRRHFDITPATNPSTSTATITLYFLQSEFDDYNTDHGTSRKPLPANSTASTANVRVRQFHGDWSGPAIDVYTGSNELIVPTSVTWNATLSAWEVTFPVTSFSGFFLTSPLVAPTPVTLLSFEGHRDGNVNKLNWKTSSEINNAGFDLEVSTDGRSFTKLDFVPTQAPNGNSNVPLSYNYTDNNPVGQVQYYRLRQVDKDGKFTYSNVVVIKGGNNVILSINRVFPNPTTSIINVDISAVQADKATLIVTDLAGRVVAKQAASLVPGSNLLQVNVAKLVSGQYIIKLLCNTNCEAATAKFNKL